MLDVFNTNAFGLVALTAAVNKLPYVPGRIGQMGLFAEEGITTTTIGIEERDGILCLVPNQVRGGSAAVNPRVGRKMRNFTALHLPMQDIVKADDVQNIRAFGSETAVETIAGKVNDKMGAMKQNIAATHEHLMIGALKGNIVDSNGSTSLCNLFTEFGLVQGTNDFAFSVPTTKIRPLCTALIRKVETALGAGVYDHVHAFVGATIFDALIDHEDVRAAYERWNNGEALRTDQRRGFLFGGIMWEEYRGSIGGVSFISATGGIAFPVGVPGLYKMHYAPADYVETVNTVGKPFYAKQTTTKFDKGIEIEVQSNPFPLVVRPQVLQAITQS